MINYHRDLSFSVAKDEARQAVLDFLPEKVEKIISLPAESFVFEAKVKIKNPDVKIYSYERKQRVIQRNMHNRYFIVKHLLYDYCHSDVFKARLDDVDFAWLDLCSTPSVEVQKNFIHMARSAKSGSRVVITLTKKIRYMKNDYKPFATVEKFVKLINAFTNGKVVRKYDYVNGRSPMTMLFIQF